MAGLYLGDVVDIGLVSQRPLVSSFLDIANVKALDSNLKISVNWSWED